MFVIEPKSKEVDSQGMSHLFLYRCAVLALFRNGGTNAYGFDIKPFVFQSWFPPSVSLKRSRILSATGQTLWSKMPFAVPKTVWLSSCAIQL